MKTESGQKIVIIGCGNLAWHLAKHLSSTKKFQIYVYNHKASKALSEFKTKLNCNTVDTLSEIITDAAFYFLCVPDRAIKKTSKLIMRTKGLVIHCSGSKSIEELKAKNKAVLYPLQTFSKEDTINWKDIPLLIEANSESNEKQIKQLAFLFSNQIILLNSAERLKLHLAAVLVNNFTNALYAEADKFISENVKAKAINFNLLLPLINQTNLKLGRLSPKEAQTGPAKRNDKEVMKQHLALLNNNKELKKLYKQLSKLIEHQQNAHA